jgi:hypothetical protein
VTGFHELRDVGVVLRPFDGTPPTPAHRASPFTAGWGATVELLADELRHLDAKQVVVELALGESDLRLDGMPRANARLAHDGVRISLQSKWGPLRYETAEFTAASWRRQDGWQVNVRAIALSMEALRKVDRYGVSKRGEQYRGWRAIPMSTDGAALIATREALDYLATFAPDGTSPAALLHNLDDVVRRAVKATHPDAGGDETDFRKVMRAKELLA